MLVGDKLKELAALPDIDGREVNLNGLFSKDVKNMPQYGRGYLEIQSYFLLPTPDTTAARQELACPGDPRDDPGESLCHPQRRDCPLRSRHLYAHHDARPAAPVPDIPNDGVISDALYKAVIANRALRMALPLAIPQGNDLSTVTGNSYSLLEGVTLNVKAHQAQGDTPLLVPSISSNGQLTYLADGASLYTLYNKKLLLLDLTAATAANSVALPELMLKKIYPSRN